MSKSKNRFRPNRDDTLATNKSFYNLAYAINRKQLHECYYSKMYQLSRYKNTWN